MPPVTKNLLIINVIVWAAANLMPPSAASNLIDMCALHYFTSEKFGFWQLFTYMFVQTGFTHLFFNMFALFIFGTVIERTFGSKRFMFYYFSCGVGAAIIQLGVFALAISHFAAELPDAMSIANISQLQVGDPVNVETMSQYKAVMDIYNLVNTPIIGASGAVYGILLAFGMLYPKAPLYLFFIPVPIQARWVVMGYAAIELLQGISNNAGDNVAHFAHLGGMLFGLVIILVWRKQHRYQ